MRTEAPIFKRCCFCLPLRHGLLAWAYLKVAVDILMGTALVLITMFIYMMIHRFDDSIYVIGTMMTVLLIDIVMNLIFIVGAHKKKLKLLVIYYNYTLALWLVMAIATAVIIVSNVTQILATYDERMDTYSLYAIAYRVTTALVYSVIQTYFLFLVRSEIMKRKNVGNFQFVNNAADAECSLQMPEYIIENEEVYKIEEYNESESICENDLETCGSKKCCKAVRDDIMVKI